MGIDERAVIAANNNADLYEAMFSAHHLDYTREPVAFVASQTPPYYSNLTVLAPGNGNDIAQRINALAKQGVAVSVKDSFCELDPHAFGLDVLFRASWMWRDQAGTEGSTDWTQVSDSADLTLWENAWKQAGSATRQHMFRPQMLQRTDIAFFGRKIGGAFEAGCIANVSSDCIGISNVFSLANSATVFAEAVAVIGTMNLRRPLVGYEAGRDLELARGAGFETVGALRVLVSNVAVE
ncbi:MAG: hypothetical protein NXI27_20245 [Alphaproteobacteria bacterium]|nr:hypothetical protein [Alphaproteobacteria bacterium]